MLRAGTSLAVLAVVVSPVTAQGVLDSFSYEGLRVAAIGLELGSQVSDRLEQSLAVGVRIDGGFFAPGVRPLVGVTVFRSRYTADRIAEFTSRLRGVVNDPTGDFTIAVGDITLTDMAIEGDLQAIGNAGGALSPYVGLGLGIHLRDAEGQAIAGTFVEDALQTVAATVNASLGVAVRLTRGLQLSFDARGMYGSGIAAATGRVGLWVRLPGGST